MSRVRFALSALTAAALGLALQAAPAAALPPYYSGVVVFSGGPTTYPNVGSMSSTTCQADATPCSVSLTTTSSNGGLDASGTGTIVDGGEVVSFSWTSNPTVTGVPEPPTPADGILGSGTDQAGHAEEVFGHVAGSPTGGTGGYLVFEAPNQVTAGAIARYVTQGSSSGNSFSTASTSCLATTACSMSLQGTGSAPSTDANPTTYTASGSGQLQYGPITVTFNYQLSTALCAPDLSVFHEESQTCGYLTGEGSDGIAPVKIAGEVVVGGFGEPFVYGFPNMQGSLVLLRDPTQ